MQRIIALRFTTLFGNLPGTAFAQLPCTQFEQESRAISEFCIRTQKSADLLAAASDAVAIDYANRFLEFDERNALTWLMEHSRAGE